jgi:hypothetical protein
MPEIVVLVPLPVFVTPPGVLVTDHIPLEGSPFRTTLPVGKTHEGCVIVPTEGALGIALTVNLKVAVAAAHGTPNGLLVVTVIVIVFPASPPFGV